jgi:FkbM family methyltransferase
MKNPLQRISINRQAAARSGLWRLVYRIYHRLRWLPAQLQAVWNNQPTVEIRNELGRFTALPLTNTIRETDPTHNIKLHPWITEAPPGIFMDVGAGSGLFTRLAVTEGAITKAYAFEGNPAVYSLLLKNIADNNLDAEGFNIAISREAGSMNLAPHSVNTGHTSSCSGKSGVNVAARPLDDFVSVRQVNPSDISLIRIESDGYELSALGGMQHTIKNMRPGSRLMVRLWNGKQASDMTFSFIKWSGFREIDHQGEYYLFEKTIEPEKDLLE